MNLKEHIVFTLIFSIILYPFFQEKVIIIFLAGVLIDGDHYLEYILTHKSLSLKKAYQRSVEGTKKAIKLAKQGIKKPFEYHLHILHTIEPYILIAILSFYSQIFLLILIGSIFHHTLDILFVIYIKRKYPLIPYDRAISLIAYLYYSSRVAHKPHK